MSPDQHDLNRLLVEVSQHYAKRGFPAHAIGVLRMTITLNTKGGRFSIHNTAHNFDGAIARLHDHFTTPSGSATEADLKAAQAIFGFSFGYRLREPKESAPASRLPGANNERLASIAGSLSQRYEKPLFVQFEIARAEPLLGVDKFESTAADLGTQEVISQFVAVAQSHGDKPSSVIVAAHRHHMERCLRLLAKYHQIEGLPSPEPYDKYDPEECQPRAMSAEEFIVSDFVSMAAMARDM
jgi:hypothetical protein